MGKLPRLGAPLKSACRWFLLVAVFAPTGLGQAPAAANDASSASDKQIATSPVTLGPGDLVEISVYGVPELNQKVRVSSSGDVYLPLVDYVRVEGLTPEDAQSLIEKKLAAGGFVNNPHVVILISESSNSGVSVLGEVARPGIYAIQGERRLYDVLSAAGGFTDRAGRTVTITHRSQPDRSSQAKLPPDFGASSEGNVIVQPGDTVVVPKGPVVYVVGDVVKPSGFVSDDETITVLKAVVLAGGPNRSASLNGAAIVRKTPTGIQQIKVPLKQILKAQAQDVPMQADDILYVPTSGGKLFAQRTVEAAFQAATAASIVAIRP